MKHRDCECMCHREGGWIHVVDCCAQARRGGGAVMMETREDANLAQNIDKEFTVLRIPRPDHTQ